MSTSPTDLSLALLAGVFLCLSGLPSCGPPDRQVRRPIDSSEITGAWKLKASSLSHLVRDGYAPPPERVHRVEFMSDGTMSFSSVLVGIDTLTYETGSGVWKLQPARDQRSSNKINNSVWIDLESQTSFRLGVREENGALSLWSYYRDPDLYEFLKYVRDN